MKTPFNEEDLDVNKISDLSVRYENLTYNEKVCFLHRIFGIMLLNVENLETRFRLIALILGIYRAYKLKNPTIDLSTFFNKFMKIDDFTTNSWIKNFLPLVENFNDGITNINTYGLKTAEEFKTEINRILNFLLPF